MLLYNSLSPRRKLLVTDLILAECELFHGESPCEIIAQHPTLPYGVGRIALEMFPSSKSSKCAVWNLETKQLIWSIPNAALMTWTSDGQEMVVICEILVEYVLGQKKQAEIKRICQRYHWETKTFLDQCEIYIPWNMSFGWLKYLVIGPKRKAILVSWLDQGVHDWAVIALPSQSPFVSETNEYEMRPMEHIEEGLFSVTSPSIIGQKPMFSPDEEFIVIGFQTYYQKTNDGGIQYQSKINFNGFLLGKISIVDITYRVVHDIIISDIVPESYWSSHAQHGKIYSDPIFLNEREFVIEFPGHSKRTYNIDDYATYRK
jgi:hypothetical protein